MDLVIRCLRDYGSLLPPWLSALLAFGSTFVLGGALCTSLVLCALNLLRGWRGLRLLHTPGALGEVIAPAGQPCVRIEIRQIGKTFRQKDPKEGVDDWWKWTETERVVAAQPFQVRTEAAIRHFAPDNDFILETELKAVEHIGIQCVRVAQLDPGTLVRVEEERGGGDDGATGTAAAPPPAVWTYRDCPAVSSGRVVIETFPNHSGYFRRARYHAWWALLLLAAIGGLGSNCGRYFLLLWRGQRVTATVARVHCSGNRDPNCWIAICYEPPRAHARAVECAGGTTYYDKAPPIGGRVAAVVWPEHRIFEIGAAAALAATVDLVCLLFVLLAAWYLFRAYDLRPWYRRRPLVHWEFVNPFPQSRNRPDTGIRLINPLKLWKNPLKLWKNPFRR